MSDLPDVPSLLRSWQIDGPPGAVARVEQFVSLLLSWNRRINLTGARTAADLIGEHLPDALAMTRLVPRNAALLDVGSGGGLPALPFAVIRPDVPTVLLEPRAKRVAFLRTAARELQLANVEVVSGRLDSLATARPGSHESFDVVSSRATFAPADWLTAAAPLLRPDGRALVFASHPEPLPVPPGWRLAAEVSYRTAARHPRWLGAFCST